MTIDIEQFVLTQTVTKELSPQAFEGIQVLCSRKVVLTGPVLKKNRQRHPEMDDKYHLLTELCTAPDYVCRNRRDAEIAVCYKVVRGLRLRAVLWLKQRNSGAGVHNSVLSFRLYHQKELRNEVKQGRVVYWRKGGNWPKKKHSCSAGPPNPCNSFDPKGG